MYTGSGSKSFWSGLIWLIPRYLFRSLVNLLCPRGAAKLCRSCNHLRRLLATATTLAAAGRASDIPAPARGGFPSDMNEVSEISPAVVERLQYGHTCPREAGVLVSRPTSRQGTFYPNREIRRPEAAGAQGEHHADIDRA